jgi:hypothetical protein
MASPALLAHILVAKYDDQLPLYRQGEIFARMGADIPRSTLIDWCGQAAAALQPLADLIRDVVVASDRIHTDDTPIPVLDPRKKRVEGLARGVKEGRIWVYVRDDRPWAGADPPAAAYWFSPDHKGEHPRAHLADFHGILQADAYKGYRALYEPGPDGVARVRELFLDDGRVAIDNNPAERALKAVVLGRKNFLFAGSDAGGEILADAMTVIETAKLSGPQSRSLPHRHPRPHPHPRSKRLDELLPWTWKADREAAPKAA